MFIGTHCAHHTEPPGDPPRTPLTQTHRHNHAPPPAQPPPHRRVTTARPAHSNRRLVLRRTPWRLDLLRLFGRAWSSAWARAQLHRVLFECSSTARGRERGRCLARLLLPAPAAALLHPVLVIVVVCRFCCSFGTERTVFDFLAITVAFLSAFALSIVLEEYKLSTRLCTQHRPLIVAAFLLCSCSCLALGKGKHEDGGEPHDGCNDGDQRWLIGTRIGTHRKRSTVDEDRRTRRESSV